MITGGVTRRDQKELSEGHVLLGGSQSNTMFSFDKVKYLNYKKKIEIEIEMIVKSG